MEAIEQPREAHAVPADEPLTPGRASGRARNFFPLDEGATPRRPVSAATKIYLRTGEYADGRLGEIFIDCMRRRRLPEPHEQFRDRDLGRPAIWRAARGIRRRVHLHALRAGGPRSRQRRDQERDLDPRLCFSRARGLLPWPRRPRPRSAGRRRSGAASSRGRRFVARRLKLPRFCPISRRDHGCSPGFPGAHDFRRAADSTDSRLPTGRQRRARRATSATRARTAGTSRLFATARASSATPAEARPAVPEKTRTRRRRRTKKRPLSHRRRPPQGCGRRAASLVSSSSLRALAAGSGMRRARGCSGPDMEKGQPNEETQARRRSARPLRRANQHYHREARDGRAPLAEALGPQEMRRRREPDEPRHRAHLSRRQRACARHVAACVRRRSALDELPAGGRARLAGPQGRKGRDRLLLQEDRNRERRRGQANHPDPAHLLVFHASQIDGIPSLASPRRRSLSPSGSRTPSSSSSERRPRPYRRRPGVLQPDFRPHPDASGRSFSSPPNWAATLPHELCIVATVIVGGVGFCAGEA